MTVIRWWLFLLLLAAFLFFFGCQEQQRPVSAPPAVVTALRLYVSVQGDDRWSGAMPAANAAKTDGPFATLAQARDAARKLRISSPGDRPIEIVVRGGTHFLREPLVLSPQDSGTAKAPLVIMAHPNERPIISGGVRITGWREANVDGRRVWTAELPEAKAGRFWFRQLFVNGERRARTRLPKQGYYHPTEVPDIDFTKVASPANPYPWLEGQRNFRFAAGELKAWSNLADVEVVALHFWVESRMPIVSIDEKERLATFSRRSVFRLTEKFEPTPLARYYVENVAEALDTPGQWYLNRATGVLTYLPRSGEDIASVDIVAPRLEQLVRFEGEPEAGRFVDHIELRGLTFRDTDWSLGDRVATKFLLPDVAGAGQAAVNVPGAIWMNGTRDSTIEDCTITGVGGYGIELAAGSQRNRISRCDIGDLGAGGVKLGLEELPDRARETGHNTISDCHIHDGGFIYRSAVGIWVGHSASNVIAHNHVHDFDYSGISVGWTWGYKPSGANNNSIEKNHVHHVGRGVLSDVAAIYTLGPSPGTVIRGNVLHDVTAHAYGGWGIYFDEGTTGVIAERNVVYRARSGSFFQNYGKDNLLRNNVFALAGEEGQLIRGKQEGSISFERNIVYFREGPVLGWNWSEGEFRFDRNLYWDARGQAPTFAGATLDAWQKRGMDAGAVVADPLFVDPEMGDFTLRAGSPASKIGFQALDLHDVGPRR